MKRFVSACFLIFSSSLLAQKDAAPKTTGPETYVIDQDHTKVEFEVAHLVVSSVKGNFKEFDGEFQFDEKDFTKTSLKSSAKTASINTDLEKRDKHLKSPDFFDAEKFPTITFTSTKAEAVDAKNLKLTGKFEMHGVTKEVVFNVKFQGKVTAFNKTRAGFKGETTINRKDFGMTFSTLADALPMVGDEVTIMITAEGVLK